MFFLFTLLVINLFGLFIYYRELKMKQLEFYTIPQQIQNIQWDGDDLEFSNLEQKIRDNANEEKIYVELMKTVLFFEESSSSNSFDMNNIKIKINSNQMSIIPVILPNLNF